jgi:hypothetical protein
VLKLLWCGRGFETLKKERCLEVCRARRLTEGDTHRRPQCLTTATTEGAEGIEAEAEVALPIPILTPGTISFKFIFNCFGFVFNRQCEVHSPHCSSLC